MKTIYLDMDGVLSNFFKDAFHAVNFHLHNAYGMEKKSITDYPKGQYSIEAFFDISTNDFWSIIGMTGEKFWSNMTPYVHASELYSYLKTKGEVIILTSPSEDPACLSGKLKWLRIYIDPDFSIKDVFFTNRKELLATPDSVLIDDLPSNCDKFRNNGGEAIPFPSGWNFGVDYDIDHIEYIKKLI